MAMNLPTAPSSTQFVIGDPDISGVASVRDCVLLLFYSENRFH
jgi:hypothetical protein